MFGDKSASEKAQEASGEQESGFFRKLVSGLEKTKQNLVAKVEQITSGRKVDEALFEELEEVLIQADCGVATAMFLVDQLRERARTERITEAEELKTILQDEMVALLEKNAAPLKTPGEKPYVIMVVGVNGAGKTTTIAKLAHRFKQENAKVLLAAADTFRAAAIDQLGVWANRLGVELIAHQEGSDPAAVAFDAVSAAKARGSDVLIIDTAGRLQTKVNLMAELGKIHRVVQRELGRDLDEVLLVVDATTGQNALSQGKIFQEAVPLTGIALTKLDGTAKGGIVLALASELELAVKLVGVGEQYEDLQDFDARAFVAALFGGGES
ncbi:MAG: signal recognition particle-docking protein FtsY [Limnochordia bacterium]|jgi:fused signal recognition particle receptor|nr:signal recognition particle-docking protein FtsY [Limnochordia bacterium]MDI9464852.1 signal recognition particle-docking protein FtsY [Bacillota bacterium]NLO96101.1 signal recognition particle-docking protein FtsY [Bacillota bacterium]HAN94238.1 signal recognition particle-docking protein FtsY [Bacillota bacterium]HOB39758.1 signal recognition particle-docking protein FtsY [Limnochordia bacterium]